MQVTMKDVCGRADPVTGDLFDLASAGLPAPYFDLSDDDIDFILDTLAERDVVAIGEIEFRAARVVRSSYLADAGVNSVALQWFAADQGSRLTPAEKVHCLMMCDAVLRANLEG